MTAGESEQWNRAWLVQRQLTQRCRAVLRGHLHPVWAYQGQPFPVRYGTSSPATLHLHPNPSRHGTSASWLQSDPDDQLRTTRHHHPPTTAANSSRSYAYHMSATDIYTHTHTHTHTLARTNSLTHTRSRAHTHTHTLAHTLTHTRSRTHTLAHALAHTHTLSHAHSRTNTDAHTLTHSLTHTHNSHSLTHTLTLAHAHTHTRSRTLTHTHTHTNTRAHKRPTCPATRQHKYSSILTRTDVAAGGWTAPRRQRNRHPLYKGLDGSQGRKISPKPGF